MPDHHVAAALGAEFIERNIGNLLALIEPACGLAVRISRAGHELAEASALQHHHAAAVLAILLLRSFLHVGRIEIRQIDGIFFGKRATVGIVFIVGAAGEEGPVLAPFDHQR